MVGLESKVFKFEELTDSMSDGITLKKAARCVLLMSQIIPRMGEISDSKELEIEEDI
jgi:hypothetical protein